VAHERGSLGVRPHHVAGVSHSDSTGMSKASHNCRNALPCPRRRCRSRPPSTIGLFAIRPQRRAFDAMNAVYMLVRSRAAFQHGLLVRDRSIARRTSSRATDSRVDWPQLAWSAMSSPVPA